MAQTHSDKSKQISKSKMQSMQDSDVIELILEDHKPLKKLIKVMKGDAELEEKFLAFEEFAPLLTMHAKPEEESIYVYMKDNDDSREEAFEGDVEHGLADQLVEEIKRTKDEDLWMARVKVLAELVEHHIEEEEEELLPTFKENSTEEDRMELAQQFLELKQVLADQQGEDSPSEVSLQDMQRSPRSKEKHH